MTGPTRAFDPFGNDAVRPSANPKAALEAAKSTTALAELQSSTAASSTATVAGAAVPIASVAAATATANPTASAFISPAAPQPAGDAQPRHASIFEIGGEPFSDNPASTQPTRLGHTMGPASSAISSTTSPIGLRPLGTIMGSPHGLFNESTYGSTQVPLPANARGASTTAVSSAHRLSQSRFGSMLGDPSVLPPPGIGRGASDMEPGMLDMSNGLLDTMKSQQTSPNNASQSALNDFFVKSLPVSRRNSREFQNLWQELEGFSINDAPAHTAGFDGHAAAARSSSGAFRGSADANTLGTSPKLPQGLLDDDILAIRPKQAAPEALPSANGLRRATGSGVSRIGSSTDFMSAAALNDGTAAQAMQSPFAPDAASGIHNMSQQQGPLLTVPRQPHRQTLTGADVLQEPRIPDMGRIGGLIRNSSTPVLNTKQYQVMQTLDDSTGQARGVLPGAGVGDMTGMMYGHQYQAYPGDYEAAAGGRLPQGAANLPYSASATGLAAQRSQAFSAAGSAASTPLVNGYGVPSPYGLGGAPMFSVGGQPVQLNGAAAHYAPSHIHMHTGQGHVKAQRHAQQQQQQQQQSQQQQSQQSQGGQGHGHYHPKHGHGKSHRKGDGEANRFANAQLEDLEGTIFDVCKDQYGCRFLQKKLEDGQENHVSLIFKEVLPHFSSLMTDPFGNYLCQKLLEHCNELQRTQIVVGVAPDLVNVSLNMHGTRAVQKMIESLSNQDQVDAVIDALRGCVVMLIRDLNGNHVIQKCLSRLSGENNQFIYDSVATSCTDVATHRHGCCVFQRCIDYATETQKTQLVQVVISEALPLVQDPFGNYVVQYVVDLKVPAYGEPLIAKFFDHICGLSVQKFSSNVMEKCIRMASPATRKQLVAPLLQRDKLEMLMRDSYGNYVVQTALDFADQHQRIEIIEAILPLLPLIRNTPYGKRIYSKLQRDGFISAVPSAAGSRHASPTLGPQHGAPISTMPMYPQIPNPAMSGHGAPAGAAALSRGVSPSAGAMNPQIAQSRVYAPAGMYYAIPPVDAAGAAQLHHNAISMMAPIHPSAGAYADGPMLASSAAAVAPSSAAAARAGVTSPAYYGTR